MYADVPGCRMHQSCWHLGGATGLSAETVRSCHLGWEGVFTAICHQASTAAMLSKVADAACACVSMDMTPYVHRTCSQRAGCTRGLPSVWWPCAGTGKTTLLRALAAHQIKGIPDNCQILHVEQEVRLCFADSEAAHLAVLLNLTS